MIGLCTAILGGMASAKSLYVLASHHQRLFDAWNINPDGTVVQQGTYNLLYALYPAGVAVHEPTATLFISSESNDLEVVDATTFASLGELPGMQFAGLAVDDRNDILYAMKRSGNQVYVYDFSRTGSSWTLTQRSGSPVTLSALYPNSGMGIALDELCDPPILWVADGGNMMVRAYDTTTWTEDTTQSFSTASTGKGAVGMGMDRRRGILYWGSMSQGAWVPPNSGSFDLYKFDLATQTLTSQYIGHNKEVVDTSVDEDTGLVYITETDGMSVWNTSTSPWTMLQRHSFGDHPATCGLAVTNVSFMPNLAIEKLDDVPDGECVGVGGGVQYTIAFENTGDTDLTGVQIVDSLPTDLDFVLASDGGVYDGVTHTVSWSIGNVAVGASGGVTLDVQVNGTAVPGSTTINYATINSNETAVTTVQEATDICTNMPPDCSRAFPSIETIWPPNHKWVEVEILGVIDPDDDPVTITIEAIWQDEPVDTFGDGAFTPDGAGLGTATAWLRAERCGAPWVPGNGRVYHVSFTADDGQGGSCSNTVQVVVPHDMEHDPVDDGALFDSTALEP